MTASPAHRAVRTAVAATVAAAAASAVFFAAAQAASNRAETTAAAERIGQHLSADCDAQGLADQLTDAALTTFDADVPEAITAIPGQYGGVVTVRLEVLPGRAVITDATDGSRLCSAPAPAAGVN